MANYFRCDSTDVKAVKTGRIFNGKLKTEAEIPNGIFVSIGALKTGENEIRELDVPNVAKQLGLVLNPEVRYEEDRMADYAIGLYRNRKGQSLRVLPLVEYDTVSLSEDFLAKALETKTSALAVGDVIEVKGNLVAGTQLDYKATASTDKYSFKITKIYNSHIPAFLAGDGKMFSPSYKMFDLELVVAEA